MERTCQRYNETRVSCQISACFKTLEATERNTIADASPTDKLCGVGLGMTDADLANKQLWKGR